MHKRPRALERGQQGLHSPIILQPAFLRLWSRFLMFFFRRSFFHRGGYFWLAVSTGQLSMDFISASRWTEHHHWVWQGQGREGAHDQCNPSSFGIEPAELQSREHLLPFVDPLEPYYSTNPFRGNIARRSENFCSRLWDSWLWFGDIIWEPFISSYPSAQILPIVKTPWGVKLYVINDCTSG